jgi:hypothetical protein
VEFRDWRCAEISADVPDSRYVGNMEDASAAA